MLNKHNSYQVVGIEETVRDGKYDGTIKSQLNCSLGSRKETIHPLFIAIHNYDYETFRSELNFLSSYDLSNLSYAGQTPLHAACLTRSFEVMKLIIDKGVKIGILNNCGETPLHIAVSEAWRDGIVELLKRGANPDALTEPNANVSVDVEQTPFHIAVKNGEVDTVLLLLKNNNLNLGKRDSEQNTLLHMAAMSGNAQLIKIFLDKDEFSTWVTSTNNDGDTPLHSLLMNCNDDTCEKDIVKCVKLLIGNQRSANCRNNKGETCLYVACKSSFSQVVEYLLSVGADPKILTESEKSTIQAACSVGNSSTLKLLLATKLVNHLILSEDSEGHAPFHKAVESCSIDCLEILLNNGDQLSNKDSNGTTRCSLILNNIPNATELLTRTFDSNIKVSSEQIHNHSFKVTFDYSILLSDDPSSLQKSIIDELSSQERYHPLLKHPLLESFLHIKWGRVKLFFYIGAFNFACFLLLHTLFIMFLYGGNTVNSWVSDPMNLAMARATYAAFYVIILVPDIFIAFANIMNYLTLWETYTKLLTLSSSAYLVFTVHHNYDMLLQRNIAAISILVGWIELMLVLAKFPRFGVYILMFTKIAKSMASFLFSFAFVIIGFSCAFEIIFHDVHTFNKLPLAILKTIVMMLGEMDYESIYDDGNFTRMFEDVKGKNAFHLYSNDALKLILLTSFTFLVPILLANLLIGLAVNDIPHLHRQGKIRRLVKQAAYIAAYERLSTILKRLYLFPNFIRKLMNRHFTICSEVTLYPNKKVRYTKRHLRVPPDALKEAIIIGAKTAEFSRKSDTEENDVMIQLKQFQTRHFKDMKILSDHFHRLTSSINENELQNSLSSAFDQILREFHDQKLMMHLMKDSITSLSNNISTLKLWKNS